MKHEAYQAFTREPGGLAQLGIAAHLGVGRLQFDQVLRDRASRIRVLGPPPLLLHLVRFEATGHGALRPVQGNAADAEQVGARGHDRQAAPNTANGFGG